MMFCIVFWLTSPIINQPLPISKILLPTSLLASLLPPPKKSKIPNKSPPSPPAQLFIPLIFKEKIFGKVVLNNKNENTIKDKIPVN